MATVRAEHAPIHHNGSISAMRPPRPQIDFRWEFVTPERAGEYLERNYHRNRNARLGWVDRLAHFLRSGKFHVTHQAIAFDTKGNLVDGQHRLKAIVEAGVGTWLAIAEGVHLEDIIAIDFGAKRTAVDQARISLHRDDITKSTAAIANAMCSGFSAAFNRTNGLQLDDLFEFIDQHQEAIAFVERWAGKRPIIAPVLAVCARAYYYVDKDDLTRFLDVLSSGVAENQVERGVVRLRDALLQWRGMGGAMLRANAQKKASWVLKAFVEGRAIAKVGSSTDDPYPLPGGPSLRLD